MRPGVGNSRTTSVIDIGTVAKAVLVLVALLVLGPTPVIAATTDTTRFSVPISEVITCSERVRVTGQFDFTSHTTLSSGGGTLVALHFRSDDIVGVGLRSGASYRLVGAATDISFEGRSVFTTTFVHHGVLIGGDPGAEHPLSFTFHATVNKKQEVSVGVDKSEC